MQEVGDALKLDGDEVDGLVLLLGGGVLGDSLDGGVDLRGVALDLLGEGGDGDGLGAGRDASGGGLLLEGSRGAGGVGHSSGGEDGASHGAGSQGEEGDKDGLHFDCCLVVS